MTKKNLNKKSKLLMMNDWHRASFVFLLLFILSSPYNANFISREQDFKASIVNNFSDAYIPSEPIHIASNQELIEQGWPGNGTINDPFRIEGLVITSGYTCISIINVTLHVLIRDCIIASRPPLVLGDGIFVRGSQNIRIENCRIRSKRSGIVLLGVSDFTIRNTTISSGTFVGINVGDCERILIESCAISETVDGVAIYDSARIIMRNCNIASIRSVGVYLSSIERCAFQNNTFWHTGFYLEDSSPVSWNNSFQDNMINGKQFGLFFKQENMILSPKDYAQIVLIECYNITIRDAVFQNVPTGIQLMESLLCKILNVTVFNCSYPAIDILSSQNCSLIANKIAETSSYGFYIRSSSGLSLESNYIYHSKNTGLIAYDSWSLEILENLIVKNYEGLILSNCPLTTLQGNVIFGNSYDGVMILDSFQSRIINNVVYKNKGDGISLIGSYGITLQFNRIFANLETGINLRECKKCEILQNEIGWNAKRNAMDSDGRENTWSKIALGNSWSNVTRIPYEIPGNTHSYDESPMLLRDSRPPTVSSVSSFQPLPSGIRLTWHTSDENPVVYELFANDTLVEVGRWFGGEIVSELELPEGTYLFRLFVHDATGEFANATMLVTLKHSIRPPTNYSPLIFSIISIGLIGVGFVCLYVLRERAHLETKRHEIVK